jgi:hypothetical protein
MSEPPRQGRLIEDARAGVRGDGTYTLRVDFSPPHPPGGKPRRYVAVQELGTGPAASLVARSKANSLRRGVLVRVLASTEEDKRGRSWLHGVQQIEAPDMPPPAWLGRQARDD